MSKRIPLNLYQHDETDKALLLSTNGNPVGAEWIPREFVEAQTALRPCNPFGRDLHGGRFSIEEWKAKELGWITTENEGQGSLPL